MNYFHAPIDKFAKIMDIHAKAFSIGPKVAFR
jgi:hypothetical protein